MFNLQTVFQEPYPGELWYSCLARNFRYWGSTTSKYKMLLFNSEYCDTVIPYPTKPRYELTVLPEDLISYEKMFYEHSIYPVQAPFLKAEKHDYLKNTTLENDFNVNVFSKKGGNRLRYCPECAKDDLRLYGEAYAHVAHHLKEFNYCPIHKIPLKYYPLSVKTNPRNEFVYFKKEKLDLNAGERISDFRFKRVCNLILELLSDEYLEYSLEDTLPCLKEYLKRGGYYIDSSAHPFQRKKFKRDVLDWYGEISGCFDSNLKDGNFPKDLLNEEVLNPVDGLLAIAFFTDSFKVFYSVKDDTLEDLPDGSQKTEESVLKWNKDEIKCVNQACPYRGTTTKAHILSEHDDTVVYTCLHCQQYVSYNTKSQSYSVLQKGKLWGERLLEMVGDGCSFRQIARELKVDYPTIKKLLRDASGLTPVSDKIMDYRKTLTENVTDVAKMGPKRFFMSYQKEIDYLIRYDPEWYEMFRKDLKRESEQWKNTRRDEADGKLLIKLKETYEQFLAVFPCQRITRYGLLNPCGGRIDSVKSLKESNAFVEEVAETVEEFRERQVRTIVDRFKENGTELTFENFFDCFTGITGALKKEKEKLFKRAVEYYMKN